MTTAEELKDIMKNWKTLGTKTMTKCSSKDGNTQLSPDTYFPNRHLERIAERY